MPTVSAPITPSSDNMTCITLKAENRHTTGHHRRETSALEPARQNRYTDPLHTASADRRHAFASNVLDAGGTLDEVQDLLGHASITSTQVYAHPDPARLRAAVDAVPSPRQTAGDDQ
jgi:site-specific recombinase XerC